jgi:uncharacterized protein DUF1016
MNGLTASGGGTAPESLHAELRALIAASRQRLAGAVNAELTRLYWTIGQRLATEVLGGERASYGAQLLDQLGQQLGHEFGRGFESRNLRRMVKFAQAFPEAAIVSTLSTQLSWSHWVGRRRRCGVTSLQFSWRAASMSFKMTCSITRSSRASSAA